MVCLVFRRAAISPLLVGADLKLESLLVSKVNDGHEGVLRRLGSVHVVNGHDALVAWHDCIVHELTDLSPSSWSAPATLTTVRELRRVTTFFFPVSLVLD